MYDALEELADLSLALQKADITLPVANRLISRQIEVFNARKECGSICYQQACQAVVEGAFKGVAINQSLNMTKEKEIQRGQFYQALSDSMASRLMPESEKLLCNSLAVLDSSTWPMAPLAPEYGEPALRLICDKFQISFSEVKPAYRSFKESGGLSKSLVFKSLMNRVNTLPVSTAECERGFSKMNIICSPLRSRLLVTHNSSLMFISVTGPPLTLWKPLPYVKSWLASNRRDATCHNCPKREPATFDTAKLSLWNVL